MGFFSAQAVLLSWTKGFLCLPLLFGSLEVLWIEGAFFWEFGNARTERDSLSGLPAQMSSSFIRKMTLILQQNTQLIMRCE